MIIHTKDYDVVIEKPKSISHKNVIYWDPSGKELKGSVRNKAKKLVEHSLVEEHGNDFLIKPIPGYNKTTYMVVNDDGFLYCNCQGFSTQVKQGKIGTCSHTLAVRYYNTIKTW